MWGKSICYLSKENIPHLEISETDTSLCGLMWRHMTCCRLLFWPPSWPDNLWKKQKGGYFSWITVQTSIAFNRKFWGTANIRLAIYAKNWMFFIAMEDADEIKDAACSVVFFSSVWLEVKIFASSGLLYALLTNLAFKKKKNNKKMGKSAGWGFFFGQNLYTC